MITRADIEANKDLVAGCFFGFIIGMAVMNTFLSALIEICPDCFVHKGQDVYCARVEGDNITFEKNPLKCEDGDWVLHPENTTLLSLGIIPRNWSAFDDFDKEDQIILEDMYGRDS